jgi:hypothetical protein
VLKNVLVLPVSSYLLIYLSSVYRLEIYLIMNLSKVVRKVATVAAVTVIGVASHVSGAFAFGNEVTVGAECYTKTSHTDGTIKQVGNETITSKFEDMVKSADGLASKAVSGTSVIQNSSEANLHTTSDSETNGRRLLLNVNVN